MTRPEPATSPPTHTDTEIGSVFVSNYPPYSSWGKGRQDLAIDALAQHPASEKDFGLYLHIPFCRKRCKFCYFKVFTDKNSDEIGRYLDALASEIEQLSGQPAIRGRSPKFVYFGGGTPSFISSKHLKTLVDRVKTAVPWTGVEEITFECEPGTLTHAKLEAIRSIGVTRLSLGIESFDDDILRNNGRAHVSKEIDRCLPWIQELDFEQLNVDLIAGMVGETWDTWRYSVARTVELAPDSVTIYQMELPFNTRYSSRILEGSFDQALADWDQKRAWHDYAFQELAKSGYEISSAYTMVRDAARTRFVYRDSVWHGCDLLGTGVASFSHIGGVHFQNVDTWGEYLAKMEAGELPVSRAYRTTEREELIREFILQLKLGRVDLAPLESKFGTNIRREFSQPLRDLESRGMLHSENGSISLTRKGLLRVDTLLPEFYDTQHRGGRYT
ncbi:MAG: coproporphyrinogen-III oxidase family protein [Acidobacteriota bacterium]